MANRSYLYSLSHRPTKYTNRPEAIGGLSEWGYDVPFVFSLLVSGAPKLSASLISEGFENEPPNAKTKLWAVTGTFAKGLARFERLAAAIRVAVGARAPSLVARLDESVSFLREHRDKYALLETIELDSMTTTNGAKLLQLATEHRERAEAIGAAVDALPSNANDAARVLIARGARTGALAPLSALRLTDACDDRSAKVPLGVSYWSKELYFNLWNRAQFEAQRHS